MEVVPKEFGALIAAVAIIDAKEGALGPVIDLALFALRLHNVQDYCHAVLIVISKELRIKNGT